MLDSLRYFNRKSEFTKDGHVEVTAENRAWERFYKRRWHHDKEVRSTHGVNCTGSCSWRVFVKNGVVTWEIQETNYPRTRPDIPNHEPRGCPRGASYSWYLYSSARIKHPMIRASLFDAYKKAKQQQSDPVKAWEQVMLDQATCNQYKSERGLGGMIRLSWDDALEITAAANIYTIKKYGPDRVAGFTPIPAFSMVSYSSGTRYLSLIGGACLSFYDFYCDLPPASPQTWGEQTDVPESADWFTSTFLMLWGSNVPVTRTPDAHFMTQARYKGTKVVVVAPDYNDATKFADMWMRPKQGTDSALGMAMGHVILKEFYADKQTPYFVDYAKQYTDLPFLVKLEKRDDKWVCGQMLRASDFDDSMQMQKNAAWRPLMMDQEGSLVIPNGTIGSRWDGDNKWNLELKDVRTGVDFDPILSVLDKREDILTVTFPFFGGAEYKNPFVNATQHADTIEHKVPVVKVNTGKEEVYCASVLDLMFANYGVDRGLGDSNAARSYAEDLPFTPHWQEQITGVPMQQVITTARQFADNAVKTEGKSMIIIGAGVNQWYNSDMTYRSAINLLVLCGCVGKPGGGWSHYVGQEKIRPLAGWAVLAFASDWQRPPRQVNSTSYFYMHSDQWRYERIGLNEILSPLADQKRWSGMSLIDCNIKAQRLGWTTCSPELNINPLDIVPKAEAEGKDPKDWVREKLHSGEITMASEDLDNPQNSPRNLFIWRSNLIGCSAKGMEYFMKHLLGAQNGVGGENLKIRGEALPKEVKWVDEEPHGKLDLVVTADYRMTTSALHSDIVFPAATWYEKNDISSTDMHPFIHPFCQAVDPVWEARSDWDLFKGLSEKFSQLCKGHLSKQKDVVLQAIQHDSPVEISEPLDVEDWRETGEMPTPGVNMANIAIVERNYPETYKRFTSLGPLMSAKGNGSKGISWNTQAEVEMLKAMNFVVSEPGESYGLPQINTDIQAAETILTLAPESNGEVAMKAWENLEKRTGRKHTHLAEGRSDELIRYDDLVAQPRKAITSPCWSGMESEKVSYNASYINVHELIPWRTLTGRQSIYQDHLWMREFGEALVTYKPPISTKAVNSLMSQIDGKEEVLALNVITPHNKWTIHSMWSDNLLMLTLGRGGPVVWISETDAAKINIKDNDWVELFNDNGATMCRAVVSQRIPEGALILYHNQERFINMPLSKHTGHRGGLHNSLARICPKPTHMIGGYAQLSYSFNYYGTIGANRDEIAIIRRIAKVEWGDEEVK